MRLVNFNESLVPKATLKQLLSYAVGAPTEGSLDRILDEVYAQPGNILYVVVENDEVLGITGLKLIGTDSAEILHIAVKQHKRNQGVGRRIVETLKEQETAAELIAETDRDAVEFYRKCGFTVFSLGEKYPGVERFWCRLRIIHASELG